MCILIVGYEASRAGIWITFERVEIEEDAVELTIR